MTQLPPDDALLEHVWRSERARIVGSIARRCHDIGLAEDAVQEAFAAAARRWPIDGMPDRPGAWLATTAYRKAIGMMRRVRPTVEVTSALVSLLETGTAKPPPVFDDDLFALLLTCCHASLSSESRIALTLRHVCDLTPAQIAAAFVVSEVAMTKRLVRARGKIRDAAISFDPPAGNRLDDRVDDVRTVIYLVFTEGHLASVDGPAIRPDLCGVAIWLARQLRQLRPDDAETTGLLALLLLQHARTPARQDAAGRLIPIAEQKREDWDDRAIAEARELLATTGAGPLGQFQLEAAIALLHMTGDDLPWPRIADLYGVLSRVNPSPVVEVNRAIAVGHADGAFAGLAIIEAVFAGGRLDDYAPLHAARAHLLELVGSQAAANAAWERSAALTANPVARAATLEHIIEVGRGPQN